MSRSIFKLVNFDPSKVRKQLRFAASRALNDSAFAAREALVAETKRLFTLRSKYTENGYRVVRSRKTRLIARVGTDRAYLVDHVFGGKRRDKAIPGRFIRKRKKQRVTRRRWPRPLLDKPKHFLLDTGTTWGRQRLRGGLKRHAKRRERLVFRVMGGKRRKRQRLRLLYVMPRRMRVKRRFRFNDIVQTAHRKTYQRALERRLREALATAK